MGGECVGGERAQEARIGGEQVTNMGGEYVLTILRRGMLLRNVSPGGTPCPTGASGRLGNAEVCELPLEARTQVCLPLVSLSNAHEEALHSAGIVPDPGMCPMGRLQSVSLSSRPVEGSLMPSTCVPGRRKAEPSTSQLPGQRPQGICSASLLRPSLSLNSPAP